MSVGTSFCAGLTLFLFLIRFFYVTESADQGETLWIVGCWLIAVLIWTFVSWKSEAAIVPFVGLDFGVGLLVGGHIVSALAVVVTSGDKRSAVNLAWEWIGVAAAWFLLRQQCRVTAFRRDILAGLIATGVSIAGLGLYQHYVEFPQMAAKFGPMFDRLKQADAGEAVNLRQAMAKEHIPVDGPGATLFEKRLRDSREPLGFFALANNLGGLLAVCLLLSANTVFWRPARFARNPSTIISFAAIALIAWCLLLTKSRTAWIGTIVGLMFLIYQIQGIRLSWLRLRAVFGALAILSLVGWGLSRIGGLDRQVLTEAPKSLQYRLQYWSATSSMIRDHFVFGVGPGQFRWKYLFYKLPEASEEIADPHNLFFDAAANGGMIAIAGLFLVCWQLFRCGGSLQQSSVKPNLSVDASDHLMGWVVYGLVTIGWLLLLLTGFDDRLLIVLPISAVLFGWLRRLFDHFSNDVHWLLIGFSSAAVGLLVHLCGAGGIGMPAITLLLLGLIAAAVDLPVPAAAKSRRMSASWAGLSAIVSVVLISALFLTGLQPVSIVTQGINAGDQLQQKGLLEAADAEYSAAAAADRWAADPWRRRAELAYRKAAAEEYRSNESFQTAVNLMNEAKRCDPASFRDDRRLGEWWFARWRKSSDDNDIAQAIESFRKAWDRYPTNADLMAELALAHAASKSNSEDAAQVAGRALKQDVINHEWGHVDRFLDDRIRLQLEQLLEGQAHLKTGQ